MLLTYVNTVTSDKITNTVIYVIYIRKIAEYTLINTHVKQKLLHLVHLYTVNNIFFNKILLVITVQQSLLNQISKQFVVRCARNVIY